MTRGNGGGIAPGTERDGLQCVAVRVRDGRRCRNTAITGSRLCANHGGTKDIPGVDRSAALQEIMKFVQPIPADHPLSNPINGFYATWRYNEGRIMFLEAKVAELGDDELTWGKTKQERINASETPGTNTTYEATKSMWLVLLDEALEQRMKLLTLAAKLGIEKARLESAQGLKNQTVTVILETLRILGNDVNDDEVKAAIRAAITLATGQNMRGTVAEQITPGDHPDAKRQAKGFPRKQIVKGAVVEPDSLDP